MTTRDQFQAKVDKASTNMERLNAIVNGPATGDNSLVGIDSGTVPTLARALSELDLDEEAVLEVALNAGLARRDGEGASEAETILFTLGYNLVAKGGLGLEEATNPAFREALGLGDAALLAADVAGGVPVLDEDEKLELARIPDAAITISHDAANQVAMLALTASRGHLAIRADTGETFALQGDDPTILSAWKRIAAPAAELASIIAMRAATWPVGRPARLRTTMNWSTGDGGGDWVWDGTSTATDNHGTIIKEAATATGRWVRENRGGDVFVEWFGAVGSTTDHTAWQRALDYSSSLGGGRVILGSAFYRLLATVNMKSGVRIVGRGKAAWENYVGFGAFPAVGRTIIEIDSIVGLSAANTNTARIEGVTLRGKDAGQSGYGTSANFDPSSVGIDLTGSSQFEADDIAFQGLANGVQSNLTNGSATTQMPSFTRWQASDCDRIFRFGTDSSTSYTVRDPLIGECLIALHCNRIVEAHWADGLRLEGLRLFQCYDMQAYVRKSIYISIDGVTAFESLNENMVFVDCESIAINGLACSRNGSYRTTSTPYPQKTSLRFTGCSNIALQGTIRQGTGIGIDLDTCVGTTINIAIDSPFWTSGSDEDGAIRLRNCVSTHLIGSIATTDNRAAQQTNCRYGVDSDAVSARTLTGSLALPLDVATIRGTGLQRANAYSFALASATTLSGSGVSAAFGSIRVYLEAGKVLRGRCVEIDAPAVQLRTVNGGSGVFWTPTFDSRGSICLEDKVLYDNSAGAAGWYSVDLLLRNTTGSEVTVPAGTQVRISTAIV